MFVFVLRLNLKAFLKLRALTKLLIVKYNFHLGGRQSPEILKRKEKKRATEFFNLKKKCKKKKRENGNIRNIFKIIYIRFTILFEFVAYFVYKTRK